MQNQCTVALCAGNLEVQVQPSSYSISKLLEFASRENPKRAFLFLSKVLGKYIPCLPSDMRKTYLDLSNKITLEGHCLVFGVAETATGLGAGVADALSNNSQHNVYYAQTTRFECAEPIAFDVFESHSHAPQHLIYDISKNVDIDTITDVVLVDDEISTGNTLNQLTQGINNYLPNLTRVHWVSLVNWMPEKTESLIFDSDENVDIQFHSLLKGEFNFSQTSNKVVKLPNTTASTLSKAVCRVDLGRKGVSIDKLNTCAFYSPEGEHIAPQNLLKSTKYIVIGTGEFIYQPFLFAEAMETAGIDVLFESTGRSPILQGGSITRKLTFYDPGNEANYYLYNLPEDRLPIILYENREQYIHSPLHKLLNAQAAILGEAP
ncbi:phosphoribosyltransferase domain-containing protein [Shewanella sp. VB17]|uniref:phosphoribosyltransferase domain-containing protein n=1 Tax=Shewanella sp. VB17 TaxID=2739432 RepID=UPI001566E7A3|nr:phosphoribosyltransferase domain-containing protein [Shewanella sp. VB17]NRD72867.1 phosphoribosyltransferase domain-containing protein [Shewanella sp. VB17]